MDYARELVAAFIAGEIEDVVTPHGEKATAYRVANRAHFVELARKFMIAEGMVDLRAFPLMNQNDSSIFGSSTHLQQVFDSLKAELNSPRQPESIRPMSPLDPNSKAAATLKNMSPDDKRRLLDELRSKRSLLTIQWSGPQRLVEMPLRKSAGSWAANDLSGDVQWLGWLDKLRDSAPLSSSLSWCWDYYLDALISITFSRGTQFSNEPSWRTIH